MVEDSKVSVEEKVVCGGPNDFTTVRHLKIHGTNFEIGRTLGRLAIERYGQSAEMYRSDPVFAKARSRYYHDNSPFHWERMRGIAAAFGVDPGDRTFDPSALTYTTGLPLFGCSVVTVPPTLTATGDAYLSRNFDFPTGSMADFLHIPMPPEAKAIQRPLFGEPYIMEWHPTDGGYSSIAIHAADLLGGTFDGMNSAGLTVSILADLDAMISPSFEPYPIHAVGMAELQEMRMLLDTCATVEEAQQNLLSLREFYAFLPSICIIADRTGRSFVYEHTPGRNAQYIIENNGKPQVVTNHELHRHSPTDPGFNSELTPETVNPMTDSFRRYRKLTELVSSHKDPLTSMDLKELHAAASRPEMLKTIELSASSHPPSPSTTGGFDARTLWHSLYNQTRRTVEYRFYLGDKTIEGGPVEARRSDYITFEMTPRAKLEVAA